jgi:prevent-host-death family protein
MDDKWEFRPGSDFAEVIDKVEHGETVEVVHGGRVVARVVPVEHERDVAKAQAAMERILELGKGVTLGPDLTIKQLIDEGRKY